MASETFFVEANHRASIAVDAVSVIASFIFVDFAIAAQNRIAHAFSVFRNADKIFVEFALGRTAVIIIRVFVVTFLVIGLNFSIAAIIDPLASTGAAIVF